MEVGNLVMEMLPSAPYINPPFAFPAAKEKRKCVRMDATCVRVDGEKKILFFLPHPRGRSFTVHGRGKNPFADKTASMG
jgi:hypothetical protein